MTNAPCSAPTPVLATHTAGPVRVLYCDTDRMGYVYYSQYLVWFEIGRTTLLRVMGSSYRTWEDDEGVYLPVRECQVKYYAPATYDDSIMIETSILKLTRASITIGYRIFRADDKQVLAEGTTTHAFVDEAGKILRVADRLLPQLF